MVYTIKKSRKSDWGTSVSGFNSCYDTGSRRSESKFLIFQSSFGAFFFGTNVFSSSWAIVLHSSGVLGAYLSKDIMASYKGLIGRFWLPL